MRPMKRSLLLASAVMVGAVSQPAVAQGRPLEIRVDMLGFQTSDGHTMVDVSFPGSVAFAFYLSSQLAVEPRLSLDNISGDGVSGTLYALGLFAPFYFKADEGKSGFFAAPGVMFQGASGDYGDETSVDYGVDVGVKWPLRDRISGRAAATWRDGDSYNKSVFGASFGIGFHWR